MNQMGDNANGSGSKSSNQNIGIEFIKKMIEKDSNIEKINIINVDKRCNVLLSFLIKIGFKSFTTQYEMISKV